MRALKEPPAARGVPGPLPAAAVKVPAVLAWMARFPRSAAVLLVAVASLRIVATYAVFNHTSDEPAHIACGMEWLDKHVYQYEHQHPPLARVASALGPYLAGSRSQGKPSFYYEGAAILYSGGHYARTLVLARLGILPFFWLASFVVYCWGNRHFGPSTAVISILLFTVMPPVLAHAGLATTDMALTAGLAAAFFSALIWCERPTLSNSALFGVATALALLSKLSALLFLPVVSAAALIWYGIARRPSISVLWVAIRRRAAPFGLAVAVACLVIWAGYRFSFGKDSVTGISLPAPEFYSGIRMVLRHNGTGHAAYLLGHYSSSGWWYYYPVVLFFKTPLAFLALVAVGAVTCLRQQRRGLAQWTFCVPLAFSVALLGSSVYSRINIGVRHILPVYCGLAIVAAVGCVELLKNARKWHGITGGALLLWLVASSGLAHPDYLAYFNAFAGSHPEAVAVDSDLDWGQDINRLAKRLRQRGVREVAFSSFVVIDPAAHGFPPVRPLRPMFPRPGWNAVSVTMWKSMRFGLYGNLPAVRSWVDDAQPVERVGKSILLFYFPETRGAP